MKMLAKQIERELETETAKIGHCAIYEDELQRSWPLNMENRKAKIEQFAKEHGFKLSSTKRGCAPSLKKTHRANDNKRDQNGDFVRYTIGMRDRRFSEQIEGMLDVMLCLPRYAWGFVLIDVDKKIGTVALQKIILRACDDSDSHMFEKFKWAIALFNREKRSAEKRK
jgi:hypothetical protein